MSNATLYEYAILWHPNEKQQEEGRKSLILVRPKVILADNEQKVLMSAAMSIPTDYQDQLDQVDIVVRPF